MSKRNQSEQNRKKRNPKAPKGAKGRFSHKSSKAATSSPAPKNTSAPKIHHLKPGFWKENLLPALLLLLIPFVLYGASLSFGYVLDDKIVLSENNFVKKGVDGIGDIFATESFTGFLGGQQDLVVGARYRPLSIATFALEWEFFGENPGISHFLNILFYALTCLLIFRVFSLFFPRKPERAWYLGIPFLAAMLYLLHPLHTEVVANIKGRDEILTVLLALVAMYFSYRYYAKEKLLPLIFSGVFFLLALFAKENALTLVPLIPLTFWFFTGADQKQLVRITLPLLAASAIFLLIRVDVIGYLLSSGKEVTGIMNNPFYGLEAGEKYATITYTLGEYLRLIFVPHPLTHDYYPYHVPIVGWGNWRVLLSLALYGGLIFVAFKTFKQKSTVSWAIIFFLLTLSITSNILFPVGTFMNERFLYLPSLAFCVLAAWFLAEKLPKWQPNWGKTAGLALLGIMGLGFVVRSYTRVPAWKNERTLNAAAIKVSKNSARANSYMGYSLYREGLEEKNISRKDSLFTAALPYVNKALEIYPEYTDALTAKGGVVSGLYQINKDLDALLNGFYELLALRPVPFIDEYMAYLNNRADANKLAAFYHKAGFQLLAEKQRNYPLALKYLNWGREIQPSNGQILEDLAITYFNSGNYQMVIQTAMTATQYGVNRPKIREYEQKARNR